MRVTDDEVGNRRESDRVTGGSAPVGRTSRQAARDPARRPSLLGGPYAYLSFEVEHRDGIILRIAAAATDYAY